MDASRSEEEEKQVSLSKKSPTARQSDRESSWQALLFIDTRL